MDREAMHPSIDGANGDGGRRADGRFGLGNKFGRGNPDCHRYAALRRAFVQATSVTKIKRLEAKLYAMALDGDVQALKLYFAYALGNPDQHLDIDVTENRDWAAETALAREKLIQKLDDMHRRMVSSGEIVEVEGGHFIPRKYAPNGGMPYGEMPETGP